MKITLIRHGQPELDLAKQQKKRVSAFEIKNIVNDYRWVSITKTQTIPAVVKTIAAQSKVCVTSDFARSIESALLLVGDNIHKSDSIYREAELPYPLWHWPKLSIRFWFVMLRCLWLCGYQQNGESVTEAKQNAKIGAQQLISYAQQHHSVVLVGHGINIHLIAKELSALGWSGATAWTKEYWGFNQFVLS